jgi:hypothetical protein
MMRAMPKPSKRNAHGADAPSPHRPGRFRDDHIAFMPAPGVHRGTFRLADESLDTSPSARAAACRAQGVADGAFFVMPTGGTRVPPRR